MKGAKSRAKSSRIEDEAARRPAATDVLDKEMTRVSGILSARAEELQGVCVRLQAQTGAQSEEMASYSITAIERFLGRLENALLTYETVGADSDLAAAIEKLRGGRRTDAARIGRRNRTSH
jgi:hypothetical protein